MASETVVSHQTSTTDEIRIDASRRLAFMALTARTLLNGNSNLELQRKPVEKTANEEVKVRQEVQNGSSVESEEMGKAEESHGHRPQSEEAAKVILSKKADEGSVRDLGSGVGEGSQGRGSESEQAEQVIEVNKADEDAVLDLDSRAGVGDGVKVETTADEEDQQPAAETVIIEAPITSADAAESTIQGSPDQPKGLSAEQNPTEADTGKCLTEEHPIKDPVNVEEQKPLQTPSVPADKEGEEEPIGEPVNVEEHTPSTPTDKEGKEQPMEEPLNVEEQARQSPSISADKEGEEQPIKEPVNVEVQVRQSPSGLADKEAEKQPIKEPVNDKVQVQQTPGVPADKEEKEQPADLGVQVLQTPSVPADKEGEELKQITEGLLDSPAAADTFQTQKEEPPATESAAEEAEKQPDHKETVPVTESMVELDVKEPESAVAIEDTESNLTLAEKTKSETGQVEDTNEKGEGKVKPAALSEEGQTQKLREDVKDQMESIEVEVDTAQSLAEDVPTEKIEEEINETKTVKTEESTKPTSGEDKVTEESKFGGEIVDRQVEVGTETAKENIPPAGRGDEGKLNEGASKGGVEEKTEEQIPNTKDGAGGKEVPSKPAQKHSNNILSKVKQSLVKAKKAIIGKSPGSK